MIDPFAWWRAALHAKQNHLQIPRDITQDGAPRRPEFGYYRKRIEKRADGTAWEAIAFYPDDDDGIVCETQWRKPPEDLDAQTELFASVWSEPVPWATYIAVTREGKSWPDEPQPQPAEDAPENPDAVIGHNAPPVRTEVERRRQEVERSKRLNEAWLKQHPDITALDATEGALLSRLGANARELAKSLEKARKDEVEPHVKAQREINQRWKPLVEDAEADARRMMDLWGQWQRASNQTANEAARKANEEALRVAEEERQKRAALEEEDEAPPPPVALVEPARVTGAVGTRMSLREREKVVITDLDALIAYMLRGERWRKELMAFAQPFANRYGRSGDLPGTKLEEQEYVA